MPQSPDHFDVIIIGGGHAGVEAAWAAANLGAHTALVTLDPTKIGVMSCNPAIGGLAKGQMVREIDALGGLMALATDATGIMFKMLNSSKGPAVQSPRAQCDKHAYAREVQRLIASRPNIEVIPGAVEDLIITDCAASSTSPERQRGVSSPRAITGVVIKHNSTTRALHAPAVVLTTGTFMRGLMHTGESQTPGGRIGESPALNLSENLSRLGFELGRLKTGTPPRLKRSTIDWEILEPQLGDNPPIPFSDLTSSSLPLPLGEGRGEGYRPLPSSSFSSPPQLSSPDSYRGRCHENVVTEGVFSPPVDAFPILPQVACRITRTTRDIHDLICANLHRAPMYSGQIESAGPRYCPSIEDKVVRFNDRDTHHVFLEPESHESDWIYCNGISTSLPRDVQDHIVRRLPGCERAEILQYGYAVEYDMVRPHQIYATCETKLISGLFLAGQINGTSGYEEAAGQGLIAGINAVRHSRGQPHITLGRDEAYLGVMMDDLVTKTPREPYRMFTSRAEHRLLLRADNTGDRLTPKGRDWGTITDERWQRFQRRRETIDAINTLIDTARVEGERLTDRVRRPRYSTNDLQRDLVSISPADTRSPAPDAFLTTILAERQYHGYIARQRAEVRRHAEMEHRAIPASFSYDTIPGLRNEARQSLKHFRPDTFGRAARLEGVSPADITILLVAAARR